MVLVTVTIPMIITVITVITPVTIITIISPVTVVAVVSVTCIMIVSPVPVIVVTPVITVAVSTARSIVVRIAAADITGLRHGRGLSLQERGRRCDTGSARGNDLGSNAGELSARCRVQCHDGRVLRQATRSHERRGRGGPRLRLTGRSLENRVGGLGCWRASGCWRPRHDCLLLRGCRLRCSRSAGCRRCSSSCGRSWGRSRSRGRGRGRNGDAEETGCRRQTCGSGKVLGAGLGLVNR